MIESFRDKETRSLAQGGRVPRFEAIQSTALRKLYQLHLAERVEDLAIPPANRLERLRGARAGQWSIRINDQWRICFEWGDGRAHNVEIVDYH